MYLSSPPFPPLNAQSTVLSVQPGLQLNTQAEPLPECHSDPIHTLAIRISEDSECPVKRPREQWNY